MLDELDELDEIAAAKDAGKPTQHYVAGTILEHIDFNLGPVDDRPDPTVNSETWNIEEWRLDP